LAYARLAPLAWQWTVDGVQQEKRRAATVCGAARDFVAFGALFKAGHPDSTFVIPTLARYSRPMSTLAEIKQAAEVVADVVSLDRALVFPVPKDRPVLVSALA
jgi:hypothetical protein